MIESSLAHCYDAITSGVVYDVDTGFITEVKDVILFDYRNVFRKKIS
ncbi:hypothetical protein HMPREF9962_0719 [Streptococcus parasanguinis SK236]|nr:hypothetical protein HMPREF9962_0719 [Streptococcus parasanguinis SK236]